MSVNLLGPSAVWRTFAFLFEGSFFLQRYHHDSLASEELHYVTDNMESFWGKNLRWKQIFTNYTALRFGEKSESLQAFHQRGAWPMMEEIQHKGSCFANIRGQWRWNNWFPNKEDKTICEVQRVITTNAPFKLKLHHWKNSRLSTMKWDNRILLMGFVQGNPSNLRVFMWWLVLFFVEWRQLKFF